MISLIRFRGSRCASPLQTRMMHTSDPLYLRMLQKITDLKRSSHPSLRDYHFQLPLESPTDEWKSLPMGKEWEDELKPYQNALSQIVERTIVKYNPELSATLEIGSGMYPIPHFLPNMRNKDQIHLSDINKYCLHSLRKMHPKNMLRQVDILSPNQTKLNYQTVVMSDVLNILSKEELGNALGGINKLLQPGGHLIHFSMREHIFIHTLDSLKAARLSYIPIVDEHNLWHGVYVIDPSRLIDFIDALKTDAIQGILLEEYVSLGPILQDDLCVRSLGQKELQIFADLSKPIENFTGLVTEKIFFEERYREELRMKLEERNFTVLEFQEEKGKYSGLGSEDRHCFGPKSNTFSIHQMTRLHSYDDKMPLGQVQEQATVHVLVAQKPPLMS